MPIIAESYNTVYRAMGLSVGGSIGRLASAFVPIIIFPIFLEDTFMPFLVFAILLIFALIAIINYPVDTTLQELD